MPQTRRHGHRQQREACNPTTRRRSTTHEGLLRDGPRGRRDAARRASVRCRPRRHAGLQPHGQHGLRVLPLGVDQHLHGLPPRGRVQRPATTSATSPASASSSARSATRTSSTSRRSSSTLGVERGCNKITQFSPNTKMFFQWEDRFKDRQFSKVVRLLGSPRGKARTIRRAAFPALSAQRDDGALHPRQA